VVQEQFNAMGTSAEVAHWSKGRGSTGFVDTPYGYLGMVHNVAMLDMGRVYSQKWVLLSRDFPHLPIWLSAPFRMPLTHMLASEDIQFPAGMVLSPDGRSVLVSYGVQDCLSGLAAVPLPLDEMSTAHANQQAKSPVIPSTRCLVPVSGVHGVCSVRTRRLRVLSPRRYMRRHDQGRSSEFSRSMAPEGRCVRVECRSESSTCRTHVCARNETDPNSSSSHSRSYI
jgi:hypothetical protein